MFSFTNIVRYGSKDLPKYFVMKQISHKMWGEFYPKSFFHQTYANLNQDSKDFKNDSGFQKLLKEMYEDFNDDKKMSPKSDLEVKSSQEKEVSYEYNFEEPASHDEFHTDIIYDYDEERILREKGLWHEKKKEKVSIPDIVYERGKTGVFDIEELVAYLRENRAQDIVVLRIPPDKKFADYMVIASGKSRRSIIVLVENFLKIYKKKKNSSDGFLKLEGKGSDWVAIDCGNIILHVLTSEIRIEKDMESLWAVGSQYDEHSQEFNNPYFDINDGSSLKNS